MYSFEVHHKVRNSKTVFRGLLKIIGVFSFQCLKVFTRCIRGRPKKRWRDNIQGDMKKYKLTEDMAQYLKYWMTKILAGPAQGDGQER